MKITPLIAFYFLTLSCCSQNLSNADLQSREKAEAVLSSKCIRDRVEGFNHIVFSSADKNFIILVDSIGSLNEYYIEFRDDKKVEVLKNTTVQLSESLKSKMFDKNSYKDGFITFNTSFYESGYEISSGNITYFVFKDILGEGHGEARLSMLIKPNPIDSSIYSYFIKRLIEYNK